MFIGDVRNHSLQGAFQTAVALARTTATTDAAEIRQRVQRAVLGEPELLLAPEFFTTWAAEHPSVAGLDIEVKRGVADNELNRYRYDVIIHKTPTPVRSLATAPSWAWTQCAGLRGLHDRLISQRPAAVRVTEIPRAGLITDVHIEAGPGRRATAGRRTRPNADAADAVDPRRIAPPRRNHRIPRRGHLGRPTRHPGCRLPHPHRPRSPAHSTADRPLPAPRPGPTNAAPTPMTPTPTPRSARCVSG